MTTGGYAIIDSSTGTMQSSHMPAGSTVSVIRKTAAESVNNSTTLQDDNHFTFAIASNEVWTFDMYAPWTASATGQIKVAVTVPTSATLHVNALSAGAGTAAFGSSVTSGEAIALATILSAGILHVHGVCVNSTNFGFVTLQWAQNGLDAGTSTTLLMNSHMIAHRIS